MIQAAYECFWIWRYYITEFILCLIFNVIIFTRQQAAGHVSGKFVLLFCAILQPLPIAARSNCRLYLQNECVHKGIIANTMVFKAARRDVASHSFESTRRRRGKATPYHSKK